MLSSTTALPSVNIASQGIKQPLVGIIMTSPGTRSVVGILRHSKYRTNVYLMENVNEEHTRQQTIIEYNQLLILVAKAKNPTQGALT